MSEVILFPIFRMTLSMYASVTNIIPNLEDDAKIGGCILLFVSSELVNGFP